MGDHLVNGPDGLSAEISQLLSGEHHDPHGLLGPHETEGSTVVRALRPSALAMRVLTGDDAKMGLPPSRLTRWVGGS